MNENATLNATIATPPTLKCEIRSDETLECTITAISKAMKYEVVNSANGNTVYIEG